MLRMLLVVCLFLFCKNSYAQDSVYFQKLPPKTQATLKSIANKYSSGVVDRSKVESDVKKSKLDFSNMDIIGVVQLVMALIAKESREDMREALEEMDAMRKRRASIREKTDAIKNEQDSLKNHLRQQYQIDSSRLALKIRDLELHIKSVEDASAPRKLEKLQRN